MPEVTAKSILLSSNAELQALAAEVNALRDENDSLRQKCQELEAENKEHKDWVDSVIVSLPPSYDGDDSPEGIIAKFLKDMETIASIIAKLTADYRLS